eukprot:11012-Pelagomonas_calceolata.AAC.1
MLREACSSIAAAVKHVEAIWMRMQACTYKRVTSLLRARAPALKERNISMKAEETLPASVKEKRHWLTRAASPLHHKAGTEWAEGIWRVAGSSRL